VPFRDFDRSYGQVTCGGEEVGFPSQLRNWPGRGL
jgi:hypothetical protein